VLGDGVAAHTVHSAGEACNASFEAVAIFLGSLHGLQEVLPQKRIGHTLIRVSRLD
jgi:hypothetical protein